MRKVESLSLKYIGYSQPENEEELELELSGLELVITTAQQRIAVLKQGKQLTRLMKNSTVEEQTNAQTVQETPLQNK